MCDQSDLQKLCHVDTVFTSTDHVTNMLKHNFKVVDDCASSPSLGIDVVKESGECASTIFQITPWQEYGECENVDSNGDSIAFEKILYGDSKTVTMQLDEEDPILECGFHDADEVNVVKGTTLYAYAGSKLFAYSGKKNINSLQDARLYYNITENCNEDVKVDIEVTSNELHHDTTMSTLTAKNMAGVEKQPVWRFRASSCANGDPRDDQCDYDMTELGESLRFYEITITATDFAGRKDQCHCQVIVVPECDDTNDQCEYLVDRWERSYPIK